MIHFDWDIPGVSLETFSPEITLLQPCLEDEIPIVPKQVELFTSLLQQEAATVEMSSFTPMALKSIIMSEKPQNTRQMFANEQTLSAQEPVNTPYITVKASVSAPLQSMFSLETLEKLESLEVLENLETTQKPIMATTNMSAMENAMPSTQISSVQIPIAQRLSTSTTMSMVQKPLTAQALSTQEPINTPSITVKNFVSTPLQPRASLENLESLEVLETLDISQKPVMAAANAPAMENIRSSMEVPFTQITTTQKSSARTPVMMQKPIIVQTQSAQETISTPHIIVKAFVSTLLQPMASLESQETPAMPYAIENAKSSVQIPTPQKPTTQMPMVQKPVITQTTFVQQPASTPYITVKASVSAPLQPMASIENLEPLETATMPYAMENAKPFVREAFVQIPMPQKLSIQMPVAQMPVTAQTQFVQVLVSTPSITVKAPASAPLQPMASIENLESLEVLDHLEPLEVLETPAMPSALENAKASVQEAFVQIPMVQTPATAQTQSVQVLVSTPSITVKAPVSTPLQPMDFLENLESLETLEISQKPVMATANAPAMENIRSSVEVPSTQITTTQKSSARTSVVQKSIFVQTQSVQEPISTSHITVKAPVSTPLQPMASLENLKSLEVLDYLEPLENLETVTMPYTMENTKPFVQEAFVQIPMPRKPSTQIPMAQTPAAAQTQSVQVFVSTPSITVKAPVSTPLQPMVSLETLESLEVLDHLEPLENLETATKPYALENAKSSIQQAFVQIPTSQKPSMQAPTAQSHSTQIPMTQMTAAAQPQSGQVLVNTPSITVKAPVSTLLQPMASLENLESLEVLDRLEPLENLETPVMALAIENTSTSTPIVSVQKPITVQTSSEHVSASTPHITIKSSNAFIQKPQTSLETPQKPLQKTSSMSDVVAPNIHPAATAISQPTDLAVPSVAPLNASSMAMSPAQILSAIVNELTSAIMVNIDENGHLGEIRLVLEPDVLDGTTILLKCDQKQVSVTFFPGAKSAEQLIIAHQSRIAETLAATGHLPVKISIINSEGRRQVRKTA